MSHTGAAESAISVCNRGTNRRADCNTSLSHKPVAHRQKHRATGIWLRGAVWQFRMRVPCEVVAAVGRKFVNRSLRTSDYREAIRQARIVAFEIEQMLRATDHGVHGETAQPRSRDPACETEADSVKRQETIAPPRDAATPHQPITPIQPILPPRPVQPVLTLKEIYQRFIDDPAANRSAKTLLAYRSIYNRLAELVGESAPIDSVSRDDCRRVFETLRSMPPNAVKRYGNICGKAVVERAKAEGLAPMSPTTVNLHLVLLSALFNWAENEGC